MSNGVIYRLSGHLRGDRRAALERMRNILALHKRAVVDRQLVCVAPKVLVAAAPAPGARLRGRYGQAARAPVGV